MRGLRVFTPERLRPFVDEARSLGAGAFVVASYGKIVPQALLDTVPIAFNVHPSLLPLYRGATPLQSALRDGRAETGVTIIAMDAGMDTGDILLQERTTVAAAETYGELHDRLALRGAALVLDAIERWERGTLERTPQGALGIPGAEIDATLTRPLGKDDLLIDWSAPPQRIVDLVRSLSPEPSARTRDAAGEPLKVARVHVEPRVEGAVPEAALDLADGRRIVVETAPGTNARAVLDAGDARIVFDSVTPAGKGPLDAARFAQFIVQSQRSAAARAR